MNQVHEKQITADNLASLKGRAGINWLVSMQSLAEWNLSTDEQVNLLGGISKRTLVNWKKKAKSNQPVELSRDTLDRLSLLAGIYKGLKMIAPEGKTAESVRKFNHVNSNKLFRGMSPKGFLLNMGTIESMYAVRRYLDAARG